MKMSRYVIHALFVFGLWLGLGLQAHGQTRTVHYYYTDPQGTPLVKTDAQGNVIARYDYTPYGNAVTSLGSPPNGPGYTGHVNDPETGLINMQARYYQPHGRFLSPDPVGPAPGNVYSFNRYAYASNNPILNIDPDGKSPMTEKEATELAESLNSTTSGKSTGFWSVVHAEAGANGYTVQSSEQNAMEKSHLASQAEANYQPGKACPAICGAASAVVAATLGDTSDASNSSANNSAKDAAETASKVTELLEKAPNKDLSEMAKGLKTAPPAIKALLFIPATKNNYKQSMSECTKPYQDRPSTRQKEGQTP